MKKLKKEKQNLKIIEIVIYLIFTILLLATHYIYIRFDNISFEQFLYNIINTEGANYSVVLEGIKFVLLYLILILLILFLIYKFYKSLKIKIYFNLGFKNKIKKIEVFKKRKITSILYLIVFIIISIYNSMLLLNIDEYIINQNSSSKLFENYYVDARDVKLKFPKKKRNLIYIYAESIESTNLSSDNGGLMEESYIPKLEQLALENINFSNTDKLGGAYTARNTSWTIAALVAQTSGIPLKLSIDSNTYKGYSNYLPGVYNLGDILEDNGYNNYFMIGSKANFGARDIYFENHGNYRIYDYNYAIEKGYIDKDYYVWWGYEDKKLFKYAKEKILKAASKEEPFNFTILTVDTHFTDGYMDSSCEEVFDNKYANSLYCSDSKIYSFVKWIQQQDFYDDTTIIITGDHLTMQNNFYDIKDGYIRTVYNTFINSPITPIKEKERLFTTLDMFPTTLAALDVDIEGNRLGLGVNLFSDEVTLLEEMGLKKLNAEIAKKSFYYDNKLLGDIYYEIEEDLKENKEQID